MYNTPPCYAIYIAGLVYEWLLSIGGLEEMEARQPARRRRVLYEYLDGSVALYKPVRRRSPSAR